MRFMTFAALVWLAVGASAAAQSRDAELMAPIQKFIDSFNKGDTAGAAATHATGADLDSDAKKNGITDPMVTLSPPTRIERNGDRAYVVVPAVYTFKQKGAAMREAAQMTFVLKRGAGAGSWLIDGWTWTGPKPQPAAAPVKK